MATSISLLESVWVLCYLLSECLKEAEGTWQHWAAPPWSEPRPSLMVSEAATGKARTGSLNWKCRLSFWACAGIQTACTYESLKLLTALCWSVKQSSGLCFLQDVCWSGHIYLFLCYILQACMRGGSLWLHPATVISCHISRQEKWEMVLYISLRLSCPWWSVFKN